MPCGTVGVNHSYTWSAVQPLTLIIAMTPITVLFTESSDPLGLQLHDEHHRRYERIKAWREAQSDPYFTEVSPQWRRVFKTADGRPQQRRADLRPAVESS